ncbi:MAG: SDR family oxidoreductase [Chitinophagaceae bacterium]
MLFKDKVVLVTGGTRGIGFAIARRLALEGARVAIVGKTLEPHPKLEGTIYTAAREIEEASGSAVLPLPGDIRSEESIREVVARTIAQYGRIDILVNNASAISLTATEQTPMKRWDLMHEINVRGTFFMCKECIPHLRKGDNPHILNLSPPLNLHPGWFSPHLAYTISKYGMSMIVLGLAEELRKDQIGVNALWPKTTIATAAVRNLLGGDFLIQRSRTPAIVADAALAIFKKSSQTCTGQFFIDEEVLREEGVTDFIPYAVNPEQNLMNDLFI